MIKKLLRPALISLVFLFPSFACTTDGTSSKTKEDNRLVSDASIAAQKEQTSVATLSNGTQVIIRNEPSSDLVSLMVGWPKGSSATPTGKKNLGIWAFDTLTMGSKNYPKDVLFALAEKYSLNIACSQGIDHSQCSLGTINDYWPQALAAFSDVILHPSFKPSDAELQRKQLLAHYESIANNPDAFTNELVNKCFYPENHPYFLSAKDSVTEMKQLKTSELSGFYQQLLQTTPMTLVVVTSMPKEKIIADLEKQFNSLPKISYTPPKIEVPPFKDDCSLVFEDRDVPTAYLLAKFSAPEVNSPDAVAATLLFNIFSEELDEEVRTKRSLSYATYAYTRQYRMGLGIIYSTTPKPEETLEVIQQVITKIKSTSYTPEDLSEFKKEFATAFYLKQETHHSIAAKLLETQLYHGSLNPFYDLPRELDKVTPEQIKSLAGKYLKNMRLGILFQKAGYKDTWAKKFISANKG